MKKCDTGTHTDAEAFLDNGIDCSDLHVQV